MLTTVVIWSTTTLNLSFYQMRKRLKGQVKHRLQQYLYFGLSLLAFFFAVFASYIYRIIPIEFFGLAFPITGLIMHFRLRYLASWSTKYRLHYLNYFTAAIITLQCVHWALVQAVGWENAVALHAMATNEHEVLQKLLLVTRIVLMLAALITHLYPILIIRELQWRNMHMHLKVFILLNIIVMLVRFRWIRNIMLFGATSLDMEIIITSALVAVFMTYLNTQFNVDLKKPQSLMSDLGHLKHLWGIICKRLPSLITEENGTNLIKVLKDELLIQEAELKRTVKLNLQLSLNEFESYLKIERFLYRAAREKKKLTLESISLECGFNSRSTLNRWMNRFTGVSPKIALSNPLPNSEIAAIRQKCDLPHKI